MMLTTEHILLESDDRVVPTLRQARKVHAGIDVRARLRRCALQLRIIDYYYLTVYARSGSAALEYVLDLRFVEAPRPSRQVAWRWLMASLILLAVAAGMAAYIASATTPWWKHAWLGPCAAVTGTWALATLIAAYRTTETIRLFSTTGRAKLLEFTGGAGTFRGLRRFMATLAAHRRLAAAARRPRRGEHLRDEMREHQRLRDLGVLTAQEYEESKRRILAEHSPGAHST